MYYSIHTIGLRKTFRNHIEYNAAVKSLYEKATGRFGMFPNENEDQYYAGIFQGTGIRVFLKRTKISGYYDFILSLNELIGGAGSFQLIRPEDLQLALDTAEEMLVREFGEEFSINKLELYRVDHCINLNVGTSESVREYIYLLYRSEMKKGYKILSDDTPDFDVNKSFTVRNNDEGIEVSFYDKKKELEQHNCEAENAEGILRVELRILRRKPLERQTPDCATNRERIACCMRASRRKIVGIAHTLLLDADYYPYKKACGIVKKQVENKMLRKRMLDMLKLTKKEFSVRKAKEKLFELHPKLKHEYYNMMIEKFESIGVNVVTLDKYSDVKFLPSLFGYLK